MNDWTQGYVADIEYTYGYYSELNPLRISLAFANAGLVAPKVGTACELGFGQGLSANIHAAASVCEWHGTDFNPTQAGFAQSLAEASGAAAYFRDAAFDDFCARPDLPDFDFIGLHGIWSWISDQNRTVIVDFLRRKLKVGGVLYISYNTLPGWSGFAPMRHLLTEHARVMGASGQGIVGRIDGALGFAEKLLALQPAYARQHPQVQDRISRIKGMSRHYLAHEYFNRDWHPMHFATMAQWLESAKLQYGCSANLLDHVGGLNLTAAQQAFLGEIPDPTFRESARDFIINQQFRKDYWVKGSRSLNKLEQLEITRQIKVLLTTPRADVPLKAAATVGEASLNESIYAPLLDQLASHQVYSFVELEHCFAGRLNRVQLNEALMVLCGMGHLQLVQDSSCSKVTRNRARRLNSHLLQRSRGSGETAFLSSPVTGGGFSVDRFPQLFLLALEHGHLSPYQWAQFAWQILAAQGQRIIKDGTALDSEASNLQELNRLALDFAGNQLPILKSLDIADA